MVFEQHIPSFPLNQFIESFIYYRDYKPDHSIDRFLPDGNVNVIIDLTDQPKYIYDNQTLKEIQTCRHVWFSGIRNNFITIPSGKNFEMFIINFHKGRAYPFVEMPMDVLTDSVVDGDLVLTNEIMELREMILESPVIALRFLKVEQFLLKKFKSRLIVNPFVSYAVDRIVSSPDPVTISGIAGKAGYSQKHLISIFKKHVGLTPKGFLKIIRFQKAIGGISLSGKTDWIKVALDSGYYDQAHFINDFRTFSGYTPTQYMQTQSDHLNYLAVE